MGEHRSGRSWLSRVLLCAALAVLSVNLVAPSPALAYASDLGAGTVHQLTYRWSFPATHNGGSASGSNTYLVYTPSGWTASDRLPLYVVLHGCPSSAGEGAEAMMDRTRMNPVADGQRFLVAYPDNGAQCWRSVSPGRENAVRGGGGDADIIAGMTRAIMSGFNVDTERVYIIGFSAGADQATTTAFAYPDLYAAVGANAGGGPSMDSSCAGMPDATVPMYAESTFEQMGVRARVVPYFAIGADGDPVDGEGDYESWVSPNPTGVHPKVTGCTRLGYLEALDIDHLVDPATSYETSYTLNGQVTQAEDGTPEQGYVWDREVALDSHGCEVAENWTVHGMGHAWSGGSTDPTNTYGINDPKGPSTDTNSWAFFRQFTLHGGNTACNPATSPATAPGQGGRPGPYRASVSANLVTVDALNVPGRLDASHLVIAPASAAVDSAAKGKAPKSLADARNLTTSLPGAGSQNLGVEATQSAPTSDSSPEHQEGAAVPAAPVLNADLATADAHAQWANGACITDGPITTAQSTLANSQLEPGGVSDEGTWTGSEVGMDDFISPAGTATSTSTISLARHAADDRYGVDATATTQVSGINVSDALYVEIVSPASAEVVATGVPGTAAQAVSQPVLRVEGMTLASGRTFTASIPGGPVIEVTPGAVTTNLSDDGTTATASGTLAHIRVLNVTGTATVADLTIGSLHAMATAPAGGVSCRTTSSGATDDATTAAPLLQRESTFTRTSSDEQGAGSLPAKSAAMSLVPDQSVFADVSRILACVLVTALGAIALLRPRKKSEEPRPF